MPGIKIISRANKYLGAAVADNPKITPITLLRESNFDGMDNLYSEMGQLLKSGAPDKISSELYFDFDKLWDNLDALAPKEGERDEMEMLQQELGDCSFKIIMSNKKTFLADSLECSTRRIVFFIEGPAKDEKAKINYNSLTFEKTDLSYMDIVFTLNRNKQISRRMVMESNAFLALFLFELVKDVPDPTKIDSYIEAFKNIEI